MLVRILRCRILLCERGAVVARRRWLFFSLRLFLPSFLAGGAPAALSLARAAPALHYTSDAGCARIVVSAFSGSAVEFPLFSLLRGCTTIRSDVVVPIHHLSSSFDCPVFAFLPPRLGSCSLFCLPSLPFRCASARYNHRCRHTAGGLSLPGSSPLVLYMLPPLCYLCLPWICR